MQRHKCLSWNKPSDTCYWKHMQVDTCITCNKVMQVDLGHMVDLDHSLGHMIDLNQCLGHMVDLYHYLGHMFSSSISLSMSSSSSSSWRKPVCLKN